MAQSDDHIAKRVMTAWLRANLTGCLFATRFAKEPSGHIRPVVLTETINATHLGEQLQPLLLDAASHAEAVIAIFPDLRTSADVARLVDAISTHKEWHCEECQWKEYQRPALLISLEWSTPSGHKSSALGLCPLGTMPVTRRAPYVSLALWPGGQMNPYRQKPSKRVSLADMPHSLTPELHDQLWLQSEQTKKSYLEGQDEGAAHPRVTFCLPQEVRPLIRALEAPSTHRKV